MTFAYFYPENGKRIFPDLEFATVDEACAWWKRRYPHAAPVQAKAPDKAAFLSPKTGVIVGVRAILSQEEIDAETDDYVADREDRARHSRGVW